MAKITVHLYDAFPLKCAPVPANVEGLVVIRVASRGFIGRIQHERQAGRTANVHRLVVNYLRTTDSRREGVSSAKRKSEY